MYRNAMSKFKSLIIAFAKRRRDVPTLVIVVCLFAAISPPAAYSISGADYVTDVQSNKSYKMASLVSSYKEMVKATGAERSKYEAYDVYEKRIYKTKQQLARFTQRSYRGNSKLSSVSIDWNNSTMMATKGVSMRCERRRGGSRNNELKFIFNIDPSLARELEAFRNDILIYYSFHFTTNNSIALESAKIVYQNEVLYSE